MSLIFSNPARSMQSIPSISEAVLDLSYSTTTLLLCLRTRLRYNNFSHIGLALDVKVDTMYVHDTQEFLTGHKACSSTLCDWH